MSEFDRQKTAQWSRQNASLANLANAVAELRRAVEDNATGSTGRVRQTLRQACDALVEAERLLIVAGLPTVSVDKRTGFSFLAFQTAVEAVREEVFSATVELQARWKCGDTPPATQARLYLTFESSRKATHELRRAANSLADSALHNEEI